MHLPMTSPTLVALVLGGVTFAMGIPIAMKLGGSRIGFLSDLGFASGPRGTALAWAVALLLAAGYSYYSVSHLPQVAQQWHATTWLKALAMLAAVAAGIFEEGFFRRLIMDGLANAKQSPAIQVVASAHAFGVAHGTWGLMSGSFQVALGATIATTCLGYGLAIVYLVGRRSLAPCIVAHALIDAVIEPGLLLSAIAGFHGH